MTHHLTEEGINDLIDRQLTVPQEVEARAHLEACEECTIALGRISVVVRSAGEIRIAIMPREDLWPSIASRTTHLPSPRRMNPWIYVLIVAAAVFAAVLTWKAISRSRAPTSHQAILAVLSATSDGDRRASLLKALPIIARDDREDQWGVFFKAVGTIESDGERRKVLLEAAKYAAGRRDVAVMVIYAANPIQSTSNKADVLVAVAKSDAVRTDDVRAIYLKIVATLPQGVDRNRARNALPPD